MPERRAHGDRCGPCLIRLGPRLHGDLMDHGRIKRRRDANTAPDIGFVRSAQHAAGRAIERDRSVARLRPCCLRHGVRSVPCPMSGRLYTSIEPAMTERPMLRHHRDRTRFRSAHSVSAAHSQNEGPRHAAPSTGSGTSDVPAHPPCSFPILIAVSKRGSRADMGATFLNDVLEDSDDRTLRVHCAFRWRANSSGTQQRR